MTSDRDAILKLLRDYAEHADENRFREWAELFEPDANPRGLRPRDRGPREARALHLEGREGQARLRHAPAISIEGDRARVAERVPLRRGGPDLRTAAGSIATNWCAAMVPGASRRAGSSSWLAAPTLLTDFNLAQLHELVAAEAPARDCIVAGDRRLTYAQVTERTRRLANFLSERGIGCRRERARSSPGNRARTTWRSTCTTGSSISRRCSPATRRAPRRSTSTTATWRRSSSTCSATRAPRAVVYHSEFAPTGRARCTAT